MAIAYLLLAAGLFTNLNKMKTGIELIAEERQRQIEVHGYNEFDDAGYTDEELTKAALCYLMPNDLKVSNEPLAIWPWQPKHYKPSPDNRIRELQKAGALIAAEIDRLQRSLACS